MNFIKFLKEAFFVLKKNPKLFVPNVVIAIFYGFLQLEIAKLLIELTWFNSLEASEAILHVERLQAIFGFSVLLLVLFLAGFLLNILVSGMYPKLAQDFYSKKKISFRKAFAYAKKRFFLLLAAITVSVLIPSFVLSLIFMELLNSVGTPMFVPLAVVSIVLTFLVFFLFYLLFSSAVLGEKKLKKVFTESFSLTKKNPLMISKAAFLPFVLSVFNFALAFLAEEPAFLVLFWVTKMLIAVIATYSFVLNPTIYLGLKGELK